GMNIGIREQLIFPEIDYDKVDKIRGMDIAIVTTARTDEEAGSCSDPSACRSARGRREHAEEGPAHQVAEAAEVQGAPVQPVPELRPAAGGLPEVRPVQDLPARPRAQGGDPRRREGELVR